MLTYLKPKCCFPIFRPFQTNLLDRLLENRGGLHLEGKYPPRQTLRNEGGLQ